MQYIHSNLPTAQANDVSHLLNLLHSDEPSTQQDGVTGLSALMDARPDLAHLIDAKMAAPALCRQLSSSKEAQIAAASTLTALAKEGPDNQLAIAHAGALPLLKHQVSDQDPLLQIKAVTALGHLAADSQPVAAWLGGTGTTNQIQQLLQSSDRELQLAAIDAIDSIARSDLQVRAMIGNPQTLTTLVQLLQAPSTDIQHAAASALANIALTSRDEVNIVMVRCGAAAALVQKLDPAQEGVCHQATRALCNLSGDNDDCDEAISNTSAVQALAAVFRSSNNRVISAAGKALGNLALYSVANQAKIAGEGVVDECLRVMASPAPPHTMEAACRLLHVLLTDSSQVHLQVLQANGCADLLRLLKSSSSGVRHAAAGALSHLVYPRNMPGWQQNNDLVNRLGMMPKFQQELAGLRAKTQSSHGDMMIDQLNDIGLSEGGHNDGVSAAAEDSQGSESDGSDQENESLTGMEEDFEGMHVNA